jgi:hypothetical protein
MALQSLDLVTRKRAAGLIRVLLQWCGIMPLFKVRTQALPFLLKNLTMCSLIGRSREGFLPRRQFRKREKNSFGADHHPGRVPAESVVVGRCPGIRLRSVHHLGHRG